MDAERFTNLLKDLRRLNVRVTGSYADGSATDGSDLDFYTTKTDEVKALLARYGVAWGSEFLGHVAAGYPVHGQSPLPIPVEFWSLFRHRPGRLPSVTVMGVTFKTH